MATLLDLPKEILLLIADFLGPIDTQNLKMTCEYLFSIFSDQFYWQHYAKTYLKENFPPIIPRCAIRHSWEWSLSQYYIEKENWSNKNNIKSVLSGNLHCASIDAVVLMQNAHFCMTGSRDRTIALWNVPSLLDGIQNPKSFNANAHSGWIWDLCENPRNNHIYSASWDKTAKEWDVHRNVRLVHTFPCIRTALSLKITESNLLAVGLYNGTMQLFDPVSCRQVGMYRFHKRPIFEMVTYQNYIYTASQDRRIGIFDLRNWQAVTYKVMSKSLPLSLSVCSDLLYVGDSWGTMHLFDTYKFIKVGTYNPIPDGRKRQITGIKHCAGSIIISSTDGFVRIFTLTHPPILISEFFIEGEAISLDYQNRVIASGNANSKLHIFVHKDHEINHEDRQ